MPLFVQGYLIVMEGVKEAVRAQMNAHLKDLKADSELCGWEKVWAYHAVWLNQLEQGLVSWYDQEEKLRFRHALGWHSTTISTAAVSTLALPPPPLPPSEEGEQTGLQLQCSSLTSL